jgi:hypothetical protein
MYYRELVINGVLSYKNSPESEWKPLSPEAMTYMIVNLKKELEKYKPSGIRM